MYVANYESNNILEFNSNGTLDHQLRHEGQQEHTTGVCSGNGDGTFKNPYGVAIGTDPYINGGRRVRRSTSPTPMTTASRSSRRAASFVADIGSPGTDAQPGTFTQLRRVAVDANGNVWGADLWGNRLVEFTRSPGGYTYDQTLPNPIVPPGETDTSVFNQVRGIAFDASGDMVAMDTVNQRVDVFDPTGNLINICGQRGFTSTGDFNWPRGVAVDPATGNYWIADTKQSDLQILPADHLAAMPAATVSRSSRVVGTALGDDNYPYSIAIGDGYAWIADTKNNRVESWNVVDRDGGRRLRHQGHRHRAVPDARRVSRVDPTTGNLFVADSVNKRVVELA